MATIKHIKTNAITDWTQPQLDDIIAGGAPPLPPPGTTLSQVVLPSDWNDDHTLILEVAGNFFIETPSNKTIYIIPSAIYAATINTIKGIQTDSGTITVAVNINGTPVTGLSAIAVTSTPQNVTATAANTIAVGDVVTVVLSANASATNLRFSMEATR
jgi:hypothetical protein